MTPDARNLVCIICRPQILLAMRGMHSLFQTTLFSGSGVVASAVPTTNQESLLRTQPCTFLLVFLETNPCPNTIPYPLLQERLKVMNIPMTN